MEVCLRSAGSFTGGLAGRGRSVACSGGAAASPATPATPAIPATPNAPATSATPFTAAAKSTGGRAGKRCDWRMLALAAATPFPLSSLLQLRPSLFLRRGAATRQRDGGGSIGGLARVPVGGFVGGRAHTALAGPSVGLLALSLAGPTAGLLADPSAGLLALSLAELTAGPSAGLLVGPSACLLAGPILAFLVRSLRARWRALLVVRGRRAENGKVLTRRTKGRAIASANGGPI
ncbi:unnamed protein product [Closterium sp. NIES-65]|nr:unnamed protein product [Closterium sp. NIES-65]